MKENFDGLDALMETIIRFEASSGSKDPEKVKDLRPVNREEAETIFNDYYDSKYGQSGKDKKKFDYLRKKHKALVPGRPDSYLYRPYGNTPSGPEKYDMQGVDDNPSMLIGDGMVLPPLEQAQSNKNKPASTPSYISGRNKARSKSRH